MPQYRIRDLERSAAPGSILATDASGVPFYLAGGDQTGERILTSENGSLKYMSVSDLLSKGFDFNATEHEVNTSFRLEGLQDLVISAQELDIKSISDFSVSSNNTVKIQAGSSVTLQGQSFFLFPFSPAIEDSGFYGKVFWVDINSQLRYSTISTSTIKEDRRNLFFTTERARKAISSGAGIQYDQATGIISSAVNTDNFIANSTKATGGNFNISGTGTANMLVSNEITSGKFNIGGQANFVTSSDGILFGTAPGNKFTFAVGQQNVLTLNGDGIGINISNNIGKALYVNGEIEARILRSDSIMFRALAGTENGIVYDEVNDLVHYRASTRHIFQIYNPNSQSFVDALVINKNGVMRLNFHPIVKTKTGYERVLTEADFFVTDQNENITGQRDGSNTSYTLSASFRLESTRVYVNGKRLGRGAGKGYIESAANSIVLSQPLTTDDELIVDFIKA